MNVNNGDLRKESLLTKLICQLFLAIKNTKKLQFFDKLQFKYFNASD
jgi:hypothetical protein